MPLSPDKEIVKKSLIHYFETLVKLSAEEELAKTIKTDLMNECFLLGKILEDVEPKTATKHPYLNLLDNSEYNRVICSALKYHVKDLDALMEKANELFGEKIIPFNSTKQERELAEETLQEIQKRDTS